MATKAETHVVAKREGNKHLAAEAEDDDPKPTFVMLGAPQTPAAAAGSRLLQMVGRRRPPIRTPSYVDYTDSNSSYGSR